MPGEAEEDAGPQPETVTVGAGTLRYLRQGEGGEPVVLLHGFGGDLNNWLFDAAGAGRGAHGATRSTCRATAARPRTSATATSTRWSTRSASSSTRQGSSARTSSGHSLGGLVAASWRARGPTACVARRSSRPAGFGAEINADYIDGFIAAESRRELKPVLQLLFADPSRSSPARSSTTC